MPSASRQFTIREEDGRFCLYSKDGDKKLGCHDTREEAEAQEAAVLAKKDAAEPDFRSIIGSLRKRLSKRVSDEFARALKNSRKRAGLRGQKAGEPQRFDYYSPMSPKLPKEDEAVGFSIGGGELGRRCGECRFFAPTACSLVEGSIEQADVCALYRPRLDYSFEEPKELASLCASEAAKDGTRAREWSLFTAFDFAEAGKTEWIPYLPIPGSYQHPSYGTITITPERNQHFVENFREGIYQSSLPLDAEHDLKVSGALGHVEKMRVNENGSVDAKVRWTDRGASMMNEDRFRFVSPEWYDEWTDPASGKVHKDVAIGGALTTRPFFKEKALRSLVAAENAIEIRLGKGIDPIRFSKEKSTMPDTKKQPQTGIIAKLREVLGFSEGQDEEMKKELRAIVTPEPEKPKPIAAPVISQVAGVPANAGQPAETAAALPVAASERIAAAESRAAKAEADAKQATEKVAKLEKDAQRKRFTDVVMGRTDTSKHCWFGEPGKNVERLVALAEKLGEDSEEFKGLVDERIAHANQIAAGELFSEKGHSLQADGDSIVAKVDAEAQKLFAESGSKYKSLAQAKTAVWEAHPDWKKQYREQSKSGR